MDAVRTTAALATLILLSACAGNKTSDSVVREEAASCGGQAHANRFIIGWEDGHFSVEHAAGIEELKRDFIEPNLEQIRFVENDRTIQMNGPRAEAAAAGATWGQDLVEAAAVWNKGVAGSGIIVGVVDSVVDTSHPQLAGRVAVNAGEIPGNGIDDDRNGFVDDVTGASFISTAVSNPVMNDHGSHVTGIILADPTRGPIHGMAPQAKFVPAPFITNDGWGNLGDAIRAMQYAAERGARVINASWGGPTCMTAMHDAFVELGRRGVLIVVAAGNEALNIDQKPSFPAAFGLGNQLTVAASRSDDLLASFSNFGTRLVQLAAPGSGILSTVPGNSTESKSGTSMATPFVVGAAALIWSARPDATAAQVRQALLNSVTIPAGKNLAVSTRGRLNVRAAYEQLLTMVP